MRADAGPPTPPVKVRVKAPSAPPKPKPSVLTQPLGNAAQPILNAQRQAKANTQKALSKVQARVSVPYVPKLKNPTSAQRGAAVSQVAGSLYRQGITTPEQVAALPKAQRVIVNRAKGYAATTAKQANAAGAIARGVQGPYSQNELAKIGKLADQQTRAQLLPNSTPDSKVGVPLIGTVNLTGIERGIGKHLAGNPIAALASGTSALGKFAGKELGVPGRALQNAIDLPANTITSLYKVGKDAATGHPGRAVGDIANPIIQTVEHPLKSFNQNPLNTVLIFRGIKGGIGQSAGRVMRTGALGETAKGAASMSREPLTIPGARVQQLRNTPATGGYSADVLTKGLQVGAENLAAKRGKPAVPVPEAVRVRFGAHQGNPPSPIMSANDIRRRTNENAQAGRTIGQHEANVAVQQSKAAISKKNTGAKPNVAVTYAAQGITDGTKADFQRYLDHITSPAVRATLTPDELARNQATEQAMRQALKNYNEPAAVKAAQAYSEHRAGQEQQVIASGLLKPSEAEAARLSPAATRLFGATGQTAKAAKVIAKQARSDAEKVANRARREYSRTNLAVARGTVPELKVANAARQQAARDLVKVRLQAAAGKAAPEDVRAARGQVRAANQAYEAQSTVMRRQAREARSSAIAVERSARQEHRAVKAAPFVGENLRPVSVSDVQNARPGAIEPAFVSHIAPDRNTSPLPAMRPGVPVEANRAGEMVAKGLVDTHPASLIEQSRTSARLVSAVNAREAHIEDFGYRGADVTQPVKTFKTAKAAEDFAHSQGLEQASGHAWTPIQRQDGSHVLVPAETVSQMTKLEKGANPGLAADAFKGASAQWRRNVLVFSPRWIVGNWGEAALRSAIAGAGPLSYLSGRRHLQELAKIDPEAAQRMGAHTVGGANYAQAEQVMHERTAAENLVGMAKAMNHLRQAPGAKQLADLYGAYTRAVFHINGKGESAFQTAMLGRALRDHPLTDGHALLKWTRKAAQDAAEGLRNTDAQVELGRMVDRMYGQYQKYGPGLRNMISTYTPFMAWTLNAVNFLYHVLPADHPVMSALMASANESTKEWRIQHHLFLDALGKTPNQVPPWLQGSIPGAGDSHLRLSRYTPFGLIANDGGNPLGGASSLLIPQVSEIVANLGGSDWMGKPLAKKGVNPGRNLLAAVVSLLEGQVPALAQAAQVSGVKLPNQADKAKSAAPTPSLGTRLRKTFDPFVYTASKPAKAGSAPSGLAAKYGAPAQTGSLTDLAKKYSSAPSTSGLSDLAKKYAPGGH